MIFLGMARKPKTKEEMKNDPIVKMLETEEARKGVRDQFMDDFDVGKEDLKIEIDENEGVDI